MMSGINMNRSHLFCPVYMYIGKRRFYLHLDIVILCTHWLCVGVLLFVLFSYVVFLLIY